jgi:hypothetical protein
MIMDSVLAFGEVLDAADQLSLEEQETLTDILKRRIIRRRRQELAAEVHSARQEYETGSCKAVAPDELMAEIIA